MTKVLISGYYGFDNTGDEAILAAIIQALQQKEKNIEIVVLSANPTKTVALYGVRALNRNSLQQIRQELKTTQLFLSGGGGLLQDVTSSRSIPYYLGLVYLAKLYRVPVAFYAQGIGPIQKQIGKALTAWIGRKVDLITLRDEKSKKELMALGIKPARIHVTADPVLALQPKGNCDQLLLEAGLTKKQKPLVGISLRHWAGEEKYLPIVLETAKQMMEKWQVQIVFLPFHLPGDYEICQQAAQLVGKGATVLKGDYHPAQYLALLGEFEMIVAMRLHALIFAGRMGVPMVGLSYDPKIDRFLDLAGQQPCLAIDKLDSTSLWTILQDRWEKRKAISLSLQEKMLPLEKKALENANLIWQLLKGGEKK